MKLYSSVLTETDVRDAFQTARWTYGADIYIDAIRTFRPRRHAHGVEFWAQSMNGTKASGHAPIGSYPRDDVARAASWSDYGVVIALLFARDPDATIAWYEGRDDFERKVREAHAGSRAKESIAFLGILPDAAYCATCQVLEHDVCSLTAGCPCCDDTITGMREGR